MKEVVQVLFDVLELLVQVVKYLKEIFDDQRSKTVLLLVNSLHLKLEDVVDSCENRTFIWHLLGDIRLTLEDALQVLPLSLDNGKQLESLSDLGNVAFPEINAVIELSIVGRTLHGREFDTVVFNDSYDVISRVDLIVLFVVGSTLLLDDVKVGRYV